MLEHDCPHGVLDLIPQLCSLTVIASETRPLLDTIQLFDFMYTRQHPHTNTSLGKWASSGSHCPSYSTVTHSWAARSPCLSRHLHQTIAPQGQWWFLHLLIPSVQPVPGLVWALKGVDKLKSNNVPVCPVRVVGPLSGPQIWTVHLPKKWGVWEVNIQILESVCLFIFNWREKIILF